MTGRHEEGLRINVRPEQRLVAHAVRQAGMSLVELIIYAALSALILSLVGGFLVRAVLTEQNVVSTVQGTNNAQLLTESIKNDVRNAKQIFAADKILVVNTADTRGGDDFVWSCQAWYFHDDGTVYSKATALSEPPADSDLATWTVFSTGVHDAAFAAVGVRGVDLSFTVDASVAAVVHTVATSRGPIDLGASTCSG